LRTILSLVALFFLLLGLRMIMSCCGRTPIGSPASQLRGFDCGSVFNPAYGFAGLQRNRHLYQHANLTVGASEPDRWGDCIWMLVLAGRGTAITAFKFTLSDQRTANDGHVHRLCRALSPVCSIC
jgi:hypothetical protein